jgi:hypothetical protein
LRLALYIPSQDFSNFVIASALQPTVCVVNNYNNSLLSRVTNGR